MMFIEAYNNLRRNRLGPLSVSRLVFLFLFFGLIVADDINVPAVIKVTLNISNEVAEVDPGFLSFTTETGRFIKRNIPYHSHHHNSKKQERFLALCQGLSLQNQFPSAFWRIGGRKSNELVFRNDKTGNFNPEKHAFSTLDWDELQLFASKLNWTVDFSINGLLRNKDGSWNSSNAEELIRYTKEKGYNVNYDLGKAPNNYHRFFNVSIEPEQLANDYLVLKSVSKELGSNSKIIGPDIAKNRIGSYFRRFLTSLKPGTLDAVTYYYCNGKKGQTSIELCMNPSHLDGFILDAPIARQIIRNSTGTKTTPIWIGEAADTYGSGVEGVSNTFAAGFLMLDKLGLAARLDFKVFLRRELIGRPSALMDNDLNHRPIYWLSVLHKLLVGRKVLDVKDSLHLKRTVRIYAHCVNEFGRHHYRKGSVVIIVLNLDLNKDAKFVLHGKLAGLNADKYLLQAPNGDVSSKKVFLNGNELDLIDDVKLPPMIPKEEEQPFVLPAKSYGFFVLNEAQAEPCMK